MKRAHVSARDLTQLERQYVEHGIRTTNATVPAVTGHLTNQWFLFNKLDLPVGLLSEMEHDPQTVEIGARVWEMSPTTAYALADWLSDCLRRYDVLVARVFRTNHRVKRLLQRGGFRLVKPGPVELYAVTRDTFLGRRERKRDG